MKKTGHFRAEYLISVLDQLKSQGINYRVSAFYSPLFETAYYDKEARLPSEILFLWLEDLYQKHGFYVSPKSWLTNPEIYPVNQLRKSSSSLEQALKLFSVLLKNIGSEAELDINFLANGKVEFEIYRREIKTPLRSFAVGQWLALSLLMRVVALYTSAKPLSLHFIGDYYEHEDVKHLLLGVPVRFQQSKIAIYFDNQDLQLQEADFFNRDSDYFSAWNVRQFIEEISPSHFSSNRLNSESLAHALGISPRHLHRNLVSQSGGESLRNMMTQLRINKAKTLLIESDMKISQIAEQLGYSVDSHFIRAFKKQVGVTPKVYRYSKKTKIKRK